MSEEINGMLHLKAFEFVKQKKISPNANILGGLFLIARKHPGTPN